MNEDQSTKKSFLTGILAGLGIFFTIGFFVLLVMFLRQGGISQKVATSAEADSAPIVENTGQAAEAQPSQPTQPAPTPPPAAKANFAITDADHIRGDVNAPITIVEFSDYQCPYCSRFHTTMQQVMNDYQGQVRWVYKHFPLDSIHPQARKAAEAAECAGEQDKFWEYSDQLLAKQADIKTSKFDVFATDLGLDVNKFNECLSSGKYAKKVEADYQEGIKSGVRGTPGNFINGQSVPGAVPYENIKAVIDGLL